MDKAGAASLLLMVTKFLLYFENLKSHFCAASPLLGRLRGSGVLHPQQRGLESEGPPRGVRTAEPIRIHSVLVFAG